jgi:hypothetical protein
VIEEANQRIVKLQPENPGRHNASQDVLLDVLEAPRLQKLQLKHLKHPETHKYRI